MAAEPIVIYSHKIDPGGVVKLLRGMEPGVAVTGADDDFSRIVITGPKKLFGRPWTLSFGHDRNYYAGPDWQRQMLGMQGFFSRFPETEITAKIMLLIQSFRFSLTTFPPPEPELYLDSADPRLKFVFAVVKHLDGVIFTPSSLRDAAGSVLYGAGDPDPRAVMPAIYKDVPHVPRSQRRRSQQGTQPDDGDPPPPSPGRVARRALALAAVTARALLEQEDRADPGVEETRQRILAWVDQGGFGDELEPDEWKVVQARLGALLPRDAVNATWRLEGLGLLAWALQQADLPAHDMLVDPGKLLPAVGILNAENAEALLADPTLRPPDELARLREQMFALHWRMTDWRLRHVAMDFADKAKNAWFGPMDLTGLRLIDNDLAIGDQPIARAPSDAIARTTSAALERHLAINWLNGGSERYSQTDVST